MIYPSKITRKGFGIVVALLSHRRQAHLKLEIVGGNPILYKVVGFRVLCNAAVSWKLSIALRVLPTLEAMKGADRTLLMSIN